MSDLHARLTARIDELAAVAIAAAQHEGGTDWYARGVIGADPPTARHVIEWDPATVLRGLAEDRDILARHAPHTVTEHLLDGSTAPVTLCSHEWRDGAGLWLEWRHCPDVLSLKRRHGIEAS